MTARLSRNFAFFCGLAAPLLSSCTARETLHDGFATYRDMTLKTEYSYSFPEGAPTHLQDLLTVALTHWNEALGRPVLRRAPDYALADVKISYTEAATLDESPAHIALLGCLSGFGAVFDCTIQLQVPARLSRPEDLAKAAYLFQQGPLDGRLYERFAYRDSGAYLRDKMIALSLVHEIGHSLGLGHTDDQRCIMAAAPSGVSAFCPSELRAAQTRLAAAKVAEN